VTPRFTASGRKKAQKGAALIAMAAVLVLGTSWLAVSRLMGSGQERLIAGQLHDNDVLREAKAALIAHVATTALQLTEYSPGRLPCPEDPAYTTDLDPENDGLAATSCTLPAVGRLPWRTLGLPRLLDNANEPLWYVVSAGWALTPAHTNPPAIQINSNTLGQLNVDSFAPGTPSTSNTVAALIIAPGGPLNIAPNANQLAAGCVARTQSRGTMPPDLRNYLECQNASSPVDASFATTVVDNAANVVMNDRMVAIAPWEIFDVAEAAIAERIERDVVPRIMDFAAWEWGATASNPIFPFAAPFGNPGTAAFTGAANTYQGLLPVTRGQNCTAGSDPRCDPGLVVWNTASIAVAKAASGSSSNTNITSIDCSPSTGAQVACTITYQRTGCGLICSVTLRTTVAAPATNVGMGFKTPATNFSGSVGWTSIVTPAVPTTLANDGSVSLTYTGSLTTTCIFVATCNGSGTVRIPIPTFPDHWVLNPTAPTGLNVPDAWWWFFNSNWHQLTYYAVAPDHSPSGAVHACSDSGTVTCLSIGNLTPPNKQRAILILAGRSLTGAARPSGSLADYIDNVNITGVSTSINQDADTTFHRAPKSPSFNDRFVVVNANP